jgi:endonuclease YncB( thermonuclease family)
MIRRLFLTCSLIVFVALLPICTTNVPAATLGLAQSPANPTATPVPGEKQAARVLRVVDGDTIVVDLEGKRTSVRYLGIDTPETHHPTDGADYWGFEAAEANRAMVREGQVVTLQRDISEADHYGRLLRYVFVGDTLVNAELVRIGLARVLFYGPDVRYKHEIMAAEEEARAAGRGLYGPVPTPPAEKPLLYKGDAWTIATTGGVVPLWPDPTRVSPDRSLPAGLQVHVVDAFWVPEAQTWWYWIGVNGFNGWVTGESLSRESPAESTPGPVLRVQAYDEIRIANESDVYAQAGTNQVAGHLKSGAVVQVTGISWVEATQAWWYHIECIDAEGWIAAEHLWQKQGS